MHNAIQKKKFTQKEQQMISSLLSYVLEVFDKNSSISNLHLDELSDVEKQLVKDVIVHVAQIPYTEPKYRYDLEL
jgi:hypothetical protein